MNEIIEKAIEFGASLAGIADITSLRDSPSYRVYGSVQWPAQAKSVLVLALVHPVSAPELDWWDDRKGGTPGNRQLIRTAKRLKKWLNSEFNIDARALPYHLEKGGIFLKDAAALAGLGTIGKNNLFISPGFGPRVRLRALLLNIDLKPSRPVEFNPCSTCDMPCRRACPRDVFKDGSYSMSLCNVQMKEDEANRVNPGTPGDDDAAHPHICVKYCRACELACPVGN